MLNEIQIRIVEKSIHDNYVIFLELFQNFFDFMNKTLFCMNMKSDS